MAMLVLMTYIMRDKKCSLLSKTSVSLQSLKTNCNFRDLQKMICQLTTSQLTFRKKVPWGTPEGAGLRLSMMAC